VLQGFVDVSTAGQLLASLPHLRCLQLGMCLPGGMGADSAGAPSELVLHHLAPLQRATQLEELYLEGPVICSRRRRQSISASMPRLLPPSLRRLSWEPVDNLQTPSLAHLTQLTFLQLNRWLGAGLASRQLPARLQQLELVDCRLEERVMDEQQQVVRRWDVKDIWDTRVQQQLTCLPNLRAITVQAQHLSRPAPMAALLTHTMLSALTLTTGGTAALWACSMCWVAGKQASPTCGAFTCALTASQSSCRCQH
jgi:hypothetical protein